LNQIITFTSRYKYIFAALGGCFYALGFPNSSDFSFPLGTYLGLLCLFVNFKELSAPSLKQEILLFLAFSVSANFFGYAWIAETIKVFGDIPFPLNYALSAVFSLIIFPQIWMYFIIKKIALNIPSSKLPKFKIGTHSRLILLSISYTLIEVYTPQQFPTHAGHPWLVAAPYIGLTKIFGVPGFSFITFWLVFSTISYLKHRSSVVFPLVVSAVFIGGNIISPLTYQVDKNKKPINVRAVQANIGNIVKLQSEKGHYKAINMVLRNYFKYSTVPSEKELDLIIWPETAYPVDIDTKDMKENDQLVPGIFMDIIDKTGAQILFGGYDQPQKVNPLGLGSLASRSELYFENTYNSTILLDQNKKFVDSYNKWKLIPFGETLPFPLIIRKILAKVIRNISYFSAGDKYTLFKTKNDFSFVTLICYEILFPDFLRDYLSNTEKKPDFIINVTNDSWYGKTSEPYQHLFLSKWRAVEFNLPVIRSTNTGITSIFWPDGSESKRLEYGLEDVLDFTIFKAQNERTVYEKFGVFSTVLMALLLFGFGFVVPKRFR
jgi:apolipoprotein N-acyltransferase